MTGTATKARPFLQWVTIRDAFPYQRLIDLQCNNDNEPPALKCKFFRWASTSPSALPVIPQGPASTNIPSSLAPTAVNHITSSGEVTCAHTGCQTQRLAPGCINKRCCRHCLLLGKCNVKTHMVASNVPLSTVPPEDSFFSFQAYGPSPTPASTAPHASTSQLSPPPTTSSTLCSLDPRPDPRYSSQIQDVFSTEWGVQQGLLASKREREAERLENTRKANAEITVHAQIRVRSLFHSLHTILMPCPGRGGSYSISVPRWVHAAILQTHRNDTRRRWL